MELRTDGAGYVKPFDILRHERPRVILNTDAKNEVDDQFAIVHAILSPGFDLRGIIAAHFGLRPGESLTPQPDSRREIDHILQLMGLSGQVRVADGAAGPLPDYCTPVGSAGAELIVEEALRDLGSPLYVAFIGPLTDMASALLLEPSIQCSDMTVIWIGGPPYEELPHYWPEYNLSNDVAAANVVFASELTVWQIPMEVCRATAMSLVEVEERVAPCGAIGEYLASQVLSMAESDANSMGYWCFGDQPAIGVMINPYCGRFRERQAPAFRFDCSMEFSMASRHVRTYESIDMRFVYEDFFMRLRKFAQQQR